MKTTDERTEAEKEEGRRFHARLESDRRSEERAERMRARVRSFGWWCVAGIGSVTIMRSWDLHGVEKRLEVAERKLVTAESVIDQDRAAYLRRFDEQLHLGTENARRLDACERRLDMHADKIWEGRETK